MTTSDDKDLWLEVLAGRAQPVDHATRQAAQAREVYRRMEEPAPDPALEARLLARIQSVNADIAQQAKAAAKAPLSAPAAPVGLLGRLLDWFSPGVGGAPLRYAGAALAVTGLAVALFSTMTPREGAEHEQMKSPPRAAVPPAPGLQGQPAAPLTLVDGQPLVRATALQSGLKALGVQAEVMPLGDAAQLDVSIPADQEAAVKAWLQEQQVAWPGGARLTIVVKSAP